MFSPAVLILVKIMWLFVWSCHCHILCLWIFKILHFSDPVSKSLVSFQWLYLHIWSCQPDFCYINSLVMLFPVIQHTKKFCITVNRPTAEAYLWTLTKKSVTICVALTNTGRQKCTFFPFSVYSTPLILQTRPRHASLVNHSCPLCPTPQAHLGVSRRNTKPRLTQCNTLQRCSWSTGERNSFQKTSLLLEQRGREALNLHNYMLST